MVLDGDEEEEEEGTLAMRPRLSFALPLTISDGFRNGLRPIARTFRMTCSARSSRSVAVMRGQWLGSNWRAGDAVEK